MSLQEALDALDAAEAAPIRHRIDLYRLPPDGATPTPAATWAEYDAMRQSGTAPKNPDGTPRACDYLRRDPPRPSDCECGAFTLHDEEVEEAKDNVVAAARTAMDPIGTTAIEAVVAGLERRIAEGSLMATAVERGNVADARAWLEGIGIPRYDKEMA